MFTKIMYIVLLIGWIIVILLAIRLLVIEITARRNALRRINYVAVAGATAGMA